MAQTFRLKGDSLGRGNIDSEPAMQRTWIGDRPLVAKPHFRGPQASIGDEAPIGDEWAIGRRCPHQ
eukprot:6000799-Pyramimonas_sp.AAC.1